MLLLGGSIALAAQNDTAFIPHKKLSPYDLFIQQKTIALFSPHSNMKTVDTLQTLQEPDSTMSDRRKHPNSANKIDSRVDYKAQDSISFDVKNKQAFLYKKGEIDYDAIKLKSEFISVNFEKRELFAEGIKDSLGNVNGEPIFFEGESEYNAKTIRYNLNTKKGIITNIVTKEGEGYLHGDKVKKENDSIMYLKSGRFTTCDLDHPHYAIEFTRSKLITNDRIITSTAYLSIENTPTPLIIPFGAFPFSKKRSSGILIPSYNWFANRGYGLEGAGYYFALNDYIDLSVRTKIYTNLSWGVDLQSNYRKKYKYFGNILVDIENVKEGIKNTSVYNELYNYSLKWSHKQDPKASKRSQFSANVNYVSQSYSKWSTNTNDFLTNETTSNIAYSTKIGNAFHLATSLGQGYNVNTREMSFELPNVNFSSDIFFPFQSQTSGGKTKWYESISVGYAGSLTNKIIAHDSVIFKKETLKKFKNGISHNIPIKHTLKVLKHFSIDSKVNYNEYWMLNSIRKEYDFEKNTLMKDTIYGFHSYRDISFGTGISTKAYGVFNFKNDYVKALRHVITPSLTFTYTPDFSNPKLGFWKSYTDTSDQEHYYSIFEDSQYPEPTRGKSGKIGFSVRNNLEMKVRSKKDTVTGTKKVILIENLTFSTGYDVAKDSLNLGNFIISGETTLFKSLRASYGSSFSPYYIDTNNRKQNQFLWKKEKKLFQKENAFWYFVLGWTFSPDMFHKKESELPVVEEVKKTDFPIISPFNNPHQLLGTHVDFSIPWSVRIDYTIRFENAFLPKTSTYRDTVIQTLNINADFNLTPNWKIIIRSGYDFKGKKLSHTTIELLRDLHCWEMRFHWIPLGFQKSWGFTIAVKAGMLKDLKYEMKQDHRDNNNFRY